MFAVVEINDKQHLVREGDILTIDGIISEKKATFSTILMIQNNDKTTIGQPYVEKATVEASIIEAGKREKDIVFKFKRKTGYKLTKGHRQNTTLIKITKISEASTKPKEKATKEDVSKTKTTPTSSKKTTEKATEKTIEKATKTAAKKTTTKKTTSSKESAK